MLQTTADEEFGLCKLTATSSERERGKCVSRSKRKRERKDAKEEASVLHCFSRTRVLNWLVIVVVIDCEALVECSNYLTRKASKSTARGSKKLL